MLPLYTSVQSSTNWKLLLLYYIFILQPMSCRCFVLLVKLLRLFSILPSSIRWLNLFIIIVFFTCYLYRFSIWCCRFLLISSESISMYDCLPAIDACHACNNIWSIARADRWVHESTWAIGNHLRSRFEQQRNNELIEADKSTINLMRILFPAFLRYSGGDRVLLALFNCDSMLSASSLFYYYCFSLYIVALYSFHCSVVVVVVVARASAVKRRFRCCTHYAWWYGKSERLFAMTRSTERNIRQSD